MTRTTPTCIYSCSRRDVTSRPRRRLARGDRRQRKTDVEPVRDDEMLVTQRHLFELLIADEAAEGLRSAAHALEDDGDALVFAAVRCL